MCSLPPPPKKQVTSAANQLDSVAQLLQQTRTQLASGGGGGGGSGPASHALLHHAPGLIGEPEALDELLFLTYLQAQYSNGGWTEAIGLFKQLQQVCACVYVRQCVWLWVACRHLAALGVCMR